MRTHTLRWLALSLLLVASLASGAIASGASTTPFATQSPQQDGDNTPYTWEEYGVTLNVPAGWEIIPNTSSFDLALVSPEAMQDPAGAFIGLQIFPSLGAGTTPRDVLEQQVGGDVTDYAIGEAEGAAVLVTSEDSEVDQQLVLVPYGTDGGALFIVASGTAADRTSYDFDGVIGSITMAPLKPDYAAIDAAWQAQLAAGEPLVAGDPDAPIAMVEYLSFTCGHCANYSHDVDRLIVLEVEPGQLRVQLEFLAGDDWAMLATKATYCATEQGQGYSAYKALFRASEAEGATEAFTTEGITRALGEEGLGLDSEALTACMESDQYTARIDATRESFIGHGLTGTPSVLLARGDDRPEMLVLPDGQTWTGGVPIAALREIINLVLTEDIAIADVFNTAAGTDSGEDSGEDAGAEDTGDDAGDTSYLDSMVSRTSSTDPLAPSDAANTASDDGGSDEGSGIDPLVLGAGIGLLVAAGGGLLLVARRQPAADTDSADDDTAA